MIAEKEKRKGWGWGVGVGVGKTEMLLPMNMQKILPSYLLFSPQELSEIDYIAAVDSVLYTCANP